MASPLDLRDWCRITCADYSNVQITDMSSSFRDGLAFCAIIHKHRPDLIHFYSLSKDNAYENNKLAFQVAETKLGIPALLDPKDVVSCEVPNALNITLYLSQFYQFFNRQTYAAEFLHLTLKTSKGHLSSKWPQTMCKLCFKPVHLIQRHVVDGEVCHRSCFRCTLCCSFLLPQFYTRGSDAGSLICTHHVTRSQNAHVDFAQKLGSTHNQIKLTFQAGYYSLGGLPITSIPNYAKQPQLLNEPVCGRANTDGKAKERSAGGIAREESSVGSKSMVQKPEPLRSPPPCGKDATVGGARPAGPEPPAAVITSEQEVRETLQPSEPCSPGVQVTGGGGRPVPAPRSMSSAGPVPAPRIKTAQRLYQSSPAAGASSQSPSPLVSPHITSQTTRRPKVTTNHPWLGIIHPGPWTQLPPAPPPVPVSQPKSNVQGPRYRPKVPPPNPFVQDVDEETCSNTEDEPLEQTQCIAVTCPAEISGQLTDQSVDTEPLLCSDEKNDADSDNGVKPRDDSIPPETGEEGSVHKEATSSEQPANTISSSLLDDSHSTSDLLPDTTEATEEAQSHISATSVFVPADASVLPHSPLVAYGQAEANECATSYQSEVCSGNRLDQKLDVFPALSSQRARAPGHGFPLIKRKVQTDQNNSTGDLHIELGEVEKKLEALEQRGVELEKKLRNCKNEKVEMQMLTEWVSLIHKRQALVCRETELVYLSQQQRLEEKQADVEFRLRCLLNKPESDWSLEDQHREKQLMNELVAVIEQRDQIVISLDQDRRREREEDVLWEAMMKNRELQKEGLKDLKKSTGKLKPAKLLKMLTLKAGSPKKTTDKSS